MLKPNTKTYDLEMKNMIKTEEIYKACDLRIGFPFEKGENQFITQKRYMFKYGARWAERVMRKKLEKLDGVYDYVRNHFYDEMETEEYEHLSNIGAGSYLAERVMRYIQELLKEEK